MSTDHQNYSTDNQMEVIEDYAKNNNMQIIARFADEGKSGLHIEKREQLKRLLKIINLGQARFKHILVYDISRWGRFYDPDEAAYYEFQCKRAGIKIHYCAEMFKNDGSFASDLSKIVKRKMAHEYIRELSVKVLNGQCNLIRRGFKQSGFAGYGLRRALIDEKGNYKGIILQHGDKKSIQSDRVILTLGPEEEVKNVRRIYSMYIDDGLSESKIAQKLNDEGIKTDLNREWRSNTVHQILTNEKYIGNYTFNKTSQRVAIQNSQSNKKIYIKNPEHKWVRFENGFEAIIERERFFRVKEIMASKVKSYSDDYLRERLQALYDKYGMISGILINEEPNMPSASVYANRYGSLIQAYELIGYTPDRDYTYIYINKQVREIYSSVVESILEEMFEFGIQDAHLKNGEIVINGEVRIVVIISPCKATNKGYASWLLKLERSRNADFSLCIRLHPDNKNKKDYYIFSKHDFEVVDGRLYEDNGLILDSFRSDNLTWFYKIFTRKEIFEDI